VSGSLALEDYNVVIGAPSIDSQATPKALLHVGANDDVFDAVEAPL